MGLEPLGSFVLPVAVRHLNALDTALRYDYASVARWIRDHAIPRHPVPLLICRIIGDRLGTTVTLADIGMAPGHDHEPATVPGLIERAAAVWRGDQKGRHPTKPFIGAQAIAPLWEWEHLPDNDNVTRTGPRRVDPVDVTRLRLARTRYQEMYRPGKGDDGGGSGCIRWRNQRTKPYMLFAALSKIRHLD